MNYVRMATMDDLAELVELVSKSTGLMTTMPRTSHEMGERLEAAQSFDDVFLFVLIEDGRIIGLSAIYEDLGRDRPFYSYKMVRLTKSSPELGVRVDSRVLHLVNDFTGAAELGTLFLDPEYRGGGRGKLLSYSRLMFIAMHRELFGDKVMAELRGWTDDRGKSPFWNAVGKRFFTLALKEADMLSGREFRFISDLMPAYPIYVDILPDDAQDVIGVPHDGSAPAMAMLGKQGLRYNGYVDIFDAGPCINAHIEDVGMVRASVELEVAGSAIELGEESTRLYVGSNLLADFRVGVVDGVRTEEYLRLSQDGQRTLHLEPGDRARTCLVV